MNVGNSTLRMSEAVNSHARRAICVEGRPREAVGRESQSVAFRESIVRQANCQGNCEVSLLHGRFADTNTSSALTITELNEASTCITSVLMCYIVFLGPSSIAERIHLQKHKRSMATAVFLRSEHPVTNNACYPEAINHQ